MTNYVIVGAEKALGELFDLNRGQHGRVYIVYIDTHPCGNYECTYVCIYIHIYTHYARVQDAWIILERRNRAESERSTSGLTIFDRAGSFVL